MKNHYKYLIIILLLTGAVNSKAQDAHLSQYDANPILLNPALTGAIDNQSFRIGTNYRTQWGSISSASYTSTGIAFDTKYKSRWGLGGYATNNDLAGFLNVFNVMASASYQITDPSETKYKITTGLQAGIIYKRIDQQEFVFDKQYEDGNFNSDNSSGENFNNTSLILPDFNWGINYVHTDNSWKIEPFAGMSVFHLSLPKESFTGEQKDNLPIKWAFNIGSKYEINEKLKLDIRSLYMIQRQAQEINFGVLAYYRINDTKYIIMGGIDLRYDEAVIFNVGLNHKSMTYRLSYDYNTSALHSITNGRGGTEISIVYTP